MTMVGTRIRKRFVVMENQQDGANRVKISTTCRFRMQTILPNEDRELRIPRQGKRDFVHIQQPGFQILVGVRTWLTETNTVRSPDFSGFNQHPLRLHKKKLDFTSQPY
jgi:hypothetical protein